ncbi:MAG: VIT1/CCC1 transporter family protein [Patescibacteria group bacterium]
MKGFSKKLFDQIRNVVFGVEDGLISTLGVLTGIAGGTNNRAVIILSGFVIILVEASSMAAGTFLSSKSENQAKEKIIKEELKRIRQNPERERKELIEFYRQRGYSDSDIDSMVSRMMANEDLLIEEMAHKEYGIVMRSDDRAKTGSRYMFLSYMVGGAIPVIPYLIFSVNVGLFFSIVLTLVGLFLLGFYKGVLTNVSRIKSGLEMLAVAATVSAIGFIIGRIVGHLIGLIN